MQGHVRVFDSLRGIMALWVAVAHTQMTFDIGPRGGLAKVFNVAFAVDVFIILSGFVIAFLISTQREKYAIFIARRAFRLFPVYLIALLISALSISEQLEIWKSIHSVGNYWQGRLGTMLDTEKYFFPHLLTHVLLLQGLASNSLPSSEFAFIEPAWSLSLEWQFYLLAPLIMAALVRPRQFSWLAILTIFFAAAYGQLGSGFLPNRIHYFLLGISSYFLYVEFRQGRLRRLPLLLFCTAMVLRSVPGVIWFSFLCVGLYEQAWVQSLKKALESSPFRILGEISYSVYVIHTLMIFPAYLLSQKLSADPAILRPATMVLTIVLTLLVSRISFKLIERPFISLGKRLSVSRK
jgi:peptidoglycan/LPS O-acetylase OafA/YrhL